MTGFRRQAAEGRLQKGTTVKFSRTFTASDVQEFGRLTRDYNPVHFEPRWCSLKGLKGPISHGLLVGSMLCEPGGQWGCLARDMSFKFIRPVYIDDTITCEMTIEDIDQRNLARVSCRMTNQQGQEVMTAGLSGYIPTASESELLSVMQAEGDPTNPIASQSGADS
jgi:3-hydroxybutyryl-CoA dehydratase